MLDNLIGTLYFVGACLLAWQIVNVASWLINKIKKYVGHYE